MISFQFQLPYYVEGFGASVIRLAIFKKHEGVAMTKMVFGWSLGPLLAGALLPPLLLSFYIALKAREESHASFANRFTELYFHFIMRFKSPPQRISSSIEIVVAFITLLILLVAAVLQGEVISFAEKTRIPKSGCQYSRCDSLEATAVLGFDHEWHATKGGILDLFVSDKAVAKKRKDISACTAGKKSAAILTTSFLPSSELAVLLNHTGLCGRRDILELRVSTLKQQGLLLEENLAVVNRVTQLCLKYHIPWLERASIEHGLFQFLHNNIGGNRVQENERELMFWDADESVARSKLPKAVPKKIRVFRDHLRSLREGVRKGFGANDMWRDENLAPWPLKSLTIAFGNLLIGFIFASITLCVQTILKSLNFPASIQALIDEFFNMPTIYTLWKTKRETAPEQGSIVAEPRYFV